MLSHSAVIMFVFSRYYKTDTKYASLAHRNGAKICLITDEINGPLQDFADINFYVSTADQRI